MAFPAPRPPGFDIFFCCWRDSEHSHAQEGVSGCAVFISPPTTYICRGYCVAFFVTPALTKSIMWALLLFVVWTLSSTIAGSYSQIFA